MKQALRYVHSIPEKEKRNPKKDIKRGERHIQWTALLSENEVNVKSTFFILSLFSDFPNNGALQLLIPYSMHRNKSSTNG